MCDIEIGGYTAIPQKNGTFLYKSKENTLPSVRVKASYRDKPQFEIIGSVEESIKKNCRTMIVNTGIDIMKFLKTL